MPTQFQDFDAIESEGASAGSFKLGGRTWKIRHQDDVPFETVRRLMANSDIEQPEDLDSLTDEERIELARRSREVMLQVGPFFSSTIVRDEVDDFMAMLQDPDSSLTLGKLRPVMEYVANIVFTAADDERPYETVQLEASWAVYNWKYLEGRLVLAGHDSESVRRLSACSVIAAAYAIRYDLAMDKDRQQAMWSSPDADPPHHLMDFLDEVDGYDVPVMEGPPATIIELKAVTDRINSVMGGREV